MLYFGNVVMLTFCKTALRIRTLSFSFVGKEAARIIPAVCSIHTTAFQQNSNRTSIVRCGRQTYGRLYPVLLVRPDGSTVNIRYSEPKRIITMPLDISTLSEAEKRARLRKQYSKTAKVGEEKDHFEDEFKVDDYSHFWKKK